MIIDKSKKYQEKEIDYYHEKSVNKIVNNYVTYYGLW